MKFSRTLISTLILTALLSACGAEPVPTISAEQVAATAVAAAQTMVAQTQAAIPTATPLPPTDTPTATPLPTDTPLPLPTLDALASPTTAPAASDPNADPCATRVLGSLKGKPTTIRIVNTTKNPITVSIYLDETESHGECGYRGYNISKNSDVVIKDLVQGCYYLWAWSTDSKSSFNSNGFGCLNNSDKWTFEVSASTIKFVGP